MQKQKAHQTSFKRHENRKQKREINNAKKFKAKQNNAYDSDQLVGECGMSNKKQWTQKKKKRTKTTKKNIHKENGPMQNSNQ